MPLAVRLPDGDANPRQEVPAAEFQPDRGDLAVPPGTERDGDRQRLFAGCFGIFGHGNVAGLGQALLQAEIDELRRRLAEIESELDEVDDELGDAEDVRDEAAATLRTATAERDAAQAALDRLGRR